MANPFQEASSLCHTSRITRLGAVDQSLNNPIPDVFDGGQVRPSRLGQVYRYRNTARRIGSRLKGRHCVPPVSSFVIRHIRFAVSLYVALSREAKVMAAVLTVHAAAIVVQYEGTLGVL
ncbi:hypothetical protein TNCV_3599881 [Trichonephila clavipes]|nr:hypothetical protein TNCV_3599881 [Trichonephila clavipes]